ncbi:hypothetical protein [Sphingomonas sp. ID0503]|uniref:hypothetical protein n=1 Tax=Sphingomonas sp. ID0503 TaxID=3399691 RepID=UPI003AFAD8AA
MSPETELAVKRGIAYCGPAFVIGYIICFGLLGHNIPPPKMLGLTSADFVASYYTRFPEVAIGMIGCCVAGLLYMPWSCLLASMLRSQDGSLSVLGLLELTGGLLTGWLLAFCPALWAACSLMAGKIDPGFIHLLHLGTWLIYDCTFMITTIQLTGLGLYVVLSRNQTIFPAWTGWSALAVGASFLPLVLVPFAADGPFAVNGLWNFFIVFGIWLFAFFTPFSFFMLRALSGDRRALAEGAGRTAHA